MNTKNNTTNTKNKNKQERACLNCTRTHHKCDKKLPGCTNCLRKKIPCELNNIVKKRGRPFNTTKKALQDKKRIIVQVDQQNRNKKIKKEEIFISSFIDQYPSESSPINQSFSYESPIHSNIVSPQDNSVQKNDNIPTIYYNSFLYSMDPIKENKDVNNMCHSSNITDIPCSSNELNFDFGLKIENPFQNDLSFYLSNPSLDVGELDLERFNYFLVNPGEDIIFH